MLTLLLALLPIHNVYNASAAQPLCAVKTQPRISMAPLMAAVVTVTIEPGGSWRKAELCLGDEASVLRCSTVFEGDSAINHPKTSRIEWRSLGLAEGEYGVVLVVSGDAGSCTATDKLTVHGFGS